MNPPPLLDVPENEICVCGRERAEHVELGSAASSEVHLAEVESIEEDVSIHLATTS